MTELPTIDWFGRWGTSVFSENTAILNFNFGQSGHIAMIKTAKLSLLNVKQMTIFN